MTKETVAKVLDMVFRNCEKIHEADSVTVNAIRCLCVAVIDKAKSGHPGAPLGCAVMAHALFGHVMTYYGPDPNWANRDRFVLSNGHASALQYVMLHLAGYSISTTDLQSFRRINSLTPGHPERNLTPGVEVTTGPLGQGIAMAVGLAIGARIFRERYGSELINHHTFVMIGDGCLQEGVQAEACSLAGMMKLGGLIVLYDNNGITIDGETKLSFTDNTIERFKAWGWKTMEVDDGNVDLPGIVRCLDEAKKITDAPVLISIRTTIGFGSKLKNTAKVHGSPLDTEDISALRKLCGVIGDPWEMPEEALKFYAERRAKNKAAYDKWQENYVKWKAANPTDAAEFESRRRDECDANLIERLYALEPTLMADAPRNTSQVVLRVIAEQMPSLVGGSADLTDCNKTDILKQVGGPQSAANPKGRYIHFGVREHGMCAIANGLAAYGGIRAFTATFLNFYGYGWAAVRLGALSHLPVLHIATHDSVELGQDGPTHQPIEITALCRATPNLHFIRPGDAHEVAGAYAVWLKSSKPCIIALARGKVELTQGTSAKSLEKGAYILKDFEQNGYKRIIIASSGSELGIAAATVPLLKAKGFNVRLVSMPCWSLFDEQSVEYRESVLPPYIPAALMEPYSSYGSHKYFKESLSMFINRFGFSGSAAEVRKEVGFVPEVWAEKIAKNF